MNTVIATLLTAAAYVTPAPEKDMDAFIRFMWAEERCPGIAINYDKTLEQVTDLGQGLQWDDARTRDKILVESRIAEFEYQQDSGAFCDKVRHLYRSYDPAYLRTVGVTD